MSNYTSVRSKRRELPALTGLTLAEFRLLLGRFTRAYERRRPAGQTEAGRRRLRPAGGGREAVPGRPEGELLFILTHVKAYPLKSSHGATPRAEPAEREPPGPPAAAGPAGRPGRVGRRAGAGPRPLRPEPPGAGEAGPRLIIDGTDRRRQRPNSPEKQALPYGGERKAHRDRDVVVADARRKRVGFPSRTYPCEAHDKATADHEAVSYPPEAVLYQDGGFQGYEPTVARTRRPEKEGRAAGFSRPASGAPTGRCRGRGPGWNRPSRA